MFMEDVEMLSQTVFGGKCTISSSEITIISGLCENVLEIAYLIPGEVT